MTDTTNAIEATVTVQDKYDSCLRDAIKTQSSLDKVEVKADKGWRARLFELAQQCDKFSKFEGYCEAASANVSGDKPRVWIQAQSDIKGIWDKHGKHPKGFKTLEALRTEKRKLNKAEQAAEKAVEQAKIESENAAKLVIPAQLSAEFDAIGRLVAACHESDYTESAGILGKAIEQLMVVRDRERDVKGVAKVTAIA